MSSERPSFLAQYLRVVAAAVFAVAALAFVSIPLSLGGHPGEPRVSQGAGAGHMT